MQQPLKQLLIFYNGGLRRNENADMHQLVDRDARADAFARKRLKRGFSVPLPGNGAELHAAGLQAFVNMDQNT